MTGAKFLVLLQALVIGLSLCLIAVPAARATPLRYVIVLAYGLVAARNVVLWRRAGYLGLRPKAIGTLNRRGDGLRVSSLGLLSSVLGAIAVVVSL